MWILMDTHTTHLYTGLGEVDPHGQVLPHEDIRIVGLRERLLQLLQLEPNRNNN